MPHSAVLEREPRLTPREPAKSAQPAVARPAPPRRFGKKYPWLKQHDETDCGAACLAMIARYWGARLSVGRLREVAQVGREGTSLLSLAAAAEKVGFLSRGVKASMEHLAKLDLPAIAHWKGYHYVVVYAVKGRHVIVADPGIGLLKMDRREFEAGWTGRLLLLSPKAELGQQSDSPTTIGRFLPYVTPHRWLLLEVFLLSLAIELLQLTSPIFTQAIVDKVLVHHNVGMLNLMLGGMLLVAFFGTASSLLRQYLLIHVSQKLSLRLSSDLFRQVLSLPLRFFQNRKIGDLMQRFSDNQTIERILTGKVVSTVLDVMMLFLVVGLMLYYNVQLTVVALAVVPIYAVLALGFAPLLKRNNQRSFEKAAAAESSLIEAINSVAAIKQCTAERTVRWGHEELLIQRTNTEFRGEKLEMALEAATAGTQAVGTAVLLWYAAHLVIQGQLTVGQLMAFQSLLGMVMAPLGGLLNLWDDLQDAWLSLQRLGDVYDADVEQPARRQAIALPEVQGAIQFVDVEFRYNTDEKPVLSQISLDVRPGQTIALVGRSGSGKTTLISLLQRFHNPTAGRILIDGFDLANTDLRTLREQIGVVAQEPVIFTKTIRENIALRDPEASLERVVQAAQIANAHEFIMSFPLGYDTLIGEMGIRLSGGQRQRINIARALLTNPRIIVFDEATSALDTESERAIQQNMGSFLKDRTALVIAHRLSTIRNADKIVVLDEGRIVEQGTHAELIQLNGLYHHLNSQQLTL